MRTTPVLVAAALLAACATSKPAAPAAAPAAGSPTLEVKATGIPGQAAAERSQKLTATITAIDKATRGLTVKGADGTSESFKVPAEVTRFDELAVGDVIEVELQQGLLLEFQPAGAEAVEPHSVVLGGKTPAGEAAGGVVAAGLQGTVTVVAIDAKTRIVTLQGSAGKQHQVKAGPQVALEKLKVGDRLIATYVEAIALQVKKAAAKP